MKRIRTALLGSGFMGRTHLEALRRVGTVEIVAIASLDQDSAKRLSNEFSVPRVESDYHAILSDPSIDAVHICTPNALHVPMATKALHADKHVLCEKPLATSLQDARALTELAARKGLRNCLSHNLRFYPMVQQVRRMVEDGDLGEILALEGGYAQDWLLYDTDWNWRVTREEGGPSRCLADIGSHWCDMIEHITGLRIGSVCTDLQTFHKTRKRPVGTIETFGSGGSEVGYEEVPVDTEDFGSTLFTIGRRGRGSFTVSQVSAGRKNRLHFEIHGTRASAGWSQERPDELWIGKREANNQVILKDPSLLKPAARSYADFPGGHGEGYPDTFKQLFRRFYASILDPSSEPEYPQFTDGMRQLAILEAEMQSHHERRWVDVPA